MKRVLFILVAVILAGCGGGSDSSAPPAPGPTQTTVSGTVFASEDFSSGLVNAYDFTGGVKGGLLASAAVGGTGNYQVTVPGSPSAILIEVDSGCYAEKAIIWLSNSTNYPSASNSTTASVCAASPSLSAAVPYGAPALVVAVTPYTHAAVGLAEYEIRNGSNTTTALNNANTRLSQWIGADILTTLPAAPTRFATSSGSYHYGSLLSGIASWLLNVATTPSGIFGEGTLTTLAFAAAMKSDLAQDGVLDGIGRDGNGNAVPLQIGTLPLTTTIYRHQLAVQAVIRLRAETEGAASATPEEATRIVSFLPSFVADNDAVGALFDASPIFALDEGGPVVNIGFPLAGAVLSGDSNLVAIVRDIVGMAVGSSTILIDGVHYTTVVNQYSPNHFINTTIFANGPHTLTVRSVNNLNHVSTASVNVTFSN